MGRKKTKKPRYAPDTALRLVTMREDLEELARRLYDMACCGSKAVWPEIAAPEEMRGDLELRRKFLRAAHTGMATAQRELVNQIGSITEPSFSHELLFRTVADSIAWQLLGLQLCYARRLFKGHRQPNLRNSNFASVVAAAEHMISTRPGCMALISDLTSFVQVGDLLTLEESGGFAIVEVKEGSKNRKIQDLLKVFAESGCERVLYDFAEQGGQKSVEQLGRTLRQAERMSYVIDVMSTGTAIDPDTKKTLRIPDEFVVLNTWDDELNRVLTESAIKGWAISVIDGCLFVGCYAESSMKMAGHMVFNVWFDEFGGTEKCPRATLLDGLQYPLALPVFLRNIPPEFKFDILFGRKQLCMGVNVEMFLEQCKKHGLRVRDASNKEATRLDQSGNRPYRHKGKVVFIGNSQTEMALMDGIFLRTMFHGQRPVQVIESLLNKHAPQPQ